MGNFIRALLLISTSCTNMNLIQHINVISFVLFYSLSMTSASGYNREAEWVSIGGKKYDFNPAPLTQSEARSRCIRFGGKLFEPKDATTNKDVFVQAGAKLNGASSLWIGVSDVGDEGSFTYLSDGTLVNFVCESSNGGKAGCWGTAEPAQFVIPSTQETVNVADQLNCVVGNPRNNGKWATIGCSVSPSIPAIVEIVGVGAEGDEDFVAAAAGVDGVVSTPSKMGSICERDDEPASTTPSAPAPAPASGSTCLKSGIAVVIGTLFLLL